MKKKSLYTLAVIGALSMGLARPVYAFDSGEYSPLIQRIVDKFKLNKTEVTTVVDTYRLEKQAEMQKQLETKLTELVKSGKLTEAQKAKILAKHAELKKNKPDFSDMTREKRRAEHDKIQTELKTWAEANGIDLKYMFLWGQGKYGKGLGVGRMGKE